MFKFKVAPLPHSLGNLKLLFIYSFFYCAYLGNLKLLDVPQIHKIKKYIRFYLNL